MKKLLLLILVMVLTITNLFADKNPAIQEAWTKYYSKAPNVSSCVKGELLDSEKKLILDKVNSIRALHNLKAVSYEVSFDSPSEEAALMMAKNEQLNHTPPNSWACWTENGYYGAEHTNLYISWHSPNQPPKTENSIVNWMIDNFSNEVGHRRWIIDPFLKKIAIGRADGMSSNNQGMAVCGMALFVIDDDKQDVSEWQSDFVGYPFEFYSPEYVFYNDGGTTKWHYLSFTYVADKYNYWSNQNVDYSTAKVEMKDENGNNIPISSTIYDNQGYGVPNCLKWMPLELKSEVKYTVKISGVKFGGKSKDFEYWFKLTDNVYSTPPAAITLSAPINSGKNVPSNTAFGWKQNNNAIRYQLQVSKKSDLSSPIINNQEISTYGYQPTQPLENNVTYYWRVRGWNDAGFGEWSPVWSFTTGAAVPSKPVLLTPENGDTQAGLTPLFSWTEQADATSFDIMVSKTQAFDGWNVRISENVSQAQYQSLNGDLDLDTKYYWKVKAKNSTGSSPWSDVWEFTTGSNIDAEVTLLEPANASTEVILTPKLAWLPVKGATGYDLQVSEGDQFKGESIKLAKTNMSETELTIKTGFLDPNVEYCWRVKAHIGDASGPWSEIWRFTTLKDINLVPNLLLPKDSTLNVPKNQEFSWGPVENAAYYELQVSEKIAFDPSSLRINETNLTSRYYTANETQLKDKTVYWWRVRAVKDKYTTYPWTYVRIFSTYDKLSGNNVIDNQSSIKVDLYPNPASQNINLELQLNNSDIITILIFDETGKIVNEINQNYFKTGKNLINISLENYLSGSYNYCIYASDGIKCGTFIIVK